MAYFDRDKYFLVWLAEPLPDDVLTSRQIFLMEPRTEEEAEVTEAEAASGYIVRNWFGPFLFSSSRGLRGRC